MPSQFKHFAKFLSKPVVYSSTPMSVLLLGLEAIIEPNLLCPCVYERNVSLIIFIFIGPDIFSFALMMVLLRPGRDSAESSKPGDTHSAGEKYGCCLIPPVMWTIILLIDGDYVACAATKWEGKYVSDKEMNIKWCKPTKPDPTKNETVLLLRYQYTIWQSQISGYGILLSFSLIILIIVTTCDCKKTAPPQNNTSQNSTQRPEQGGGFSQAEGEPAAQGEGESGAQAEGIPLVSLESH